MRRWIHIFLVFFLQLFFLLEDSVRGSRTGAVVVLVLVVELFLFFVCIVAIRFMECRAGSGLARLFLLLVEKSFSVVLVIEIFCFFVTGIN